MVCLQELKSQNTFKVIRNLDLKRLVSKREWVDKRSHVTIGSKKEPVAELVGPGGAGQG